MNLNENHPSSLWGTQLYIATWQWLLAPREYPFSNVSRLLSTFDYDVATTLSPDQRQMVANAIKWISLFDIIPNTKIEGFIAGLSKFESEPAAFCFEKNIVQYLLKLKESVPALMNPELFGLNHLDTLPRDLKHSLTQIVTVKNTESHFMVVDLTAHKVFWNHGKSQLISQSLCNAIEFLRRKNSCTFAEMARIAFGYHIYDSLHHESRIYNVLARLKKCLPSSLRVFTKDGHVYIEGLWNDVHMITPSVHSVQVQNDEIWKMFIQQNLSSQRVSKNEIKFTHSILKRFEKVSKIKRKDLEQATGLSKSSAHRLITQWLNDGVLERKGHAKNTSYIYKKLDSIIDS